MGETALPGERHACWLWSPAKTHFALRPKGGADLSAHSKRSSQLSTQLQKQTIGFDDIINVC